MGFIFTSKSVLTEKQRKMYAAEKAQNFRWISKLLATYSTYTLSDKDLTPVELGVELSKIGQFAELCYSTIPIELLLQLFTELNQIDFPLEGYDAFKDVILISSFKGTFGKLPAYVAYRATRKQLVVVVSGTSSVEHALHDLRFFKRRHPSGKGAVHSGFWDLYSGIKLDALAGIKKGLEEHEVDELVITGHSMGGSIATLLVMDILELGDLPPGLNLIIATFGAPRAGDAGLVEHWRMLIASVRQANGFNFLKEYAVKGYNDGVPALPPAKIGYRHFAEEPLYTVNGLLYRVPSSECEHSLFRVLPAEGNDEHTSEYPYGGHNYYSGRQLERFIRRIAWLDSAKFAEPGWEDRYKILANKHA
ncbi:Alpha/Beta hydrolase protein [Crucibulum laeve]|uniref:Alpha/Beta hydrolase protein n=1 Tax=Crucibulum laeve TaxID=68775 RepID=A0A5C3M1L5_9AGAR|nr:Alpha/Beta hydrolase protein [Crucibulum laeve]